MDVERTLVEGTSDEPSSELQQLSSKKAGRPTPIVRTSATKLMKLQRNIRDIVTGNFEFRNTRSETRIFTRKRRTSQRSKSTLEATTSPILPFSQNRRNPSSANKYPCPRNL
jgi:hypothetical protein